MRASSSVSMSRRGWLSRNVVKTFSRVTVPVAPVKTGAAWRPDGSGVGVVVGALVEVGGGVAVEVCAGVSVGVAVNSGAGVSLAGVVGVLAWDNGAASVLRVRAVIAPRLAGIESRYRAARRTSVRRVTRRLCLW